MTPTPTTTKAPPEVAWANACQKASEAWIKAQPTPIVVYSTKGLFDDTPDLEQPVYRYSEGVCGFGWIIVRDGRSSFARWLKARNIGTQSGYYGGRMVSSSDLVPEDRASQSYDRKCQAVWAAAEALREAGINVETVTRLD
jgi:hypothetical protein